MAYVPISSIQVILTVQRIYQSANEASVRDSPTFDLRKKYRIEIAHSCHETETFIMIRLCFTCHHSKFGFHHHTFFHVFLQRNSSLHWRHFFFRPAHHHIKNIITFLRIHSSSSLSPLSSSSDICMVTRILFRSGCLKAQCYRLRDRGFPRASVV